MQFMMWQYDKESHKDPFDYFMRKYGDPSCYAVGNGVQIIPPDGVKELEIHVPDGQVWIGEVVDKYGERQNGI